MKKKFLSVGMIALVSLIASCGGTGTTSVAPGTDTGKTDDPAATKDYKATGANDIILLNFKPEIAGKWGRIQDGIKKDLNINLQIDNAANGQYDTVLRQNISTDKAPAIFQINGAVGYSNFSDYIANLDDADVTKAENANYVLNIDGHVKALAVTVEGYGIIYNKALTDKYFELTDRADTGVSNMEEIKSYDTLKKVVEDMQAKKTALGIDGVFSPSGMDSSTSWRITGHAFDMPLAAEFPSTTEKTPEAFNFTAADNFRNLLDLYVNNSTMTSTQMVSSTWTSEADAFANQKTIMVQNGQWATGDLTKGGKVKGDDLRFLPLYCGINNDNIKEETQGINIGTEAYWCVNDKVTSAKQDSAKRVLNWMFNGAGKQYVKEDLGFLPPFTGFNSDELAPSDPLVKQTVAWMNRTDVKPVPWEFTLVPDTDNQRADMVTNLTKYYNNNLSDDAWAEYVAGTKQKWSQLVSTLK